MKLVLDHHNNVGAAPYGVIDIAGVKFYFSYDTIVGVCCTRNGGYGVWHKANAWGPTTAKHMNDMFTRRDSHTLCDEEFDALCATVLTERILALVAARLAD